MSLQSEFYNMTYEDRVAYYRIILGRYISYMKHKQNDFHVKNIRIFGFIKVFASQIVVCVIGA